MATLINLGVNYDKMKDFVNDKGYVNLNVWINDDVDQYNNNVSATVKQTKEQWEAKVPKVYVGNGKVTKSEGDIKVIEYQPKEELGSAQQSMAGRNVTEDDGLPF